MKINYNINCTELTKLTSEYLHLPITFKQIIDEFDTLRRNVELDFWHTTREMHNFYGSQNAWTELVYRQELLHSLSDHLFTIGKLLNCKYINNYSATKDDIVSLIVDHFDEIVSVDEYAKDGIYITTV